MKGPEAAIKDEIRAWLRSEGAYVFSPVQMGYGTQTLDLLVCYKGAFFGLEVKAPGKHATARQDATIEEIKAAGGGAFVVSNVKDIETVFQVWRENGLIE